MTFDTAKTIYQIICAVVVLGVIVIGIIEWRAR